MYALSALYIMSFIDTFVLGQKLPNKAVKNHGI